MMDSSNDKLKHLELTQGVINRMAQNSFLIKGWTVTLVSALFALAAKDANSLFVFITYVPVVMFWLLDTYFLYQERLFRDLYEDARKKDTTDFSMSTKPFDKGIVSFFNAWTSIPQLLFYASIIVTVVIIKHQIFPAS